MIVDEDAPQHVLLSVADQQTSKQGKKELSEKEIEEQKSHGIFYDDGYDYLQHLRESQKGCVGWEKLEKSNVDEKGREKTKINLPSVVFESEEQEKVGLMNRAIPMGLRLDLDPEVFAALEDDFDFENEENQMSEDFLDSILKEERMGEIDEDEDEDYDEESEDDSSGHMEVSDEERDDVASLNGKQFTFKDEETRSRFTEYSMSSSVMRRNDQLSLLDDRFEKMYAEYDDNEIGALDCEEIEGHIDPDSELLLKHVEKFMEEQKDDQSEAKDIAMLMKDRLKIIEQEDSSSDDDQNFGKLVVEARERDRWDCESILSTYSNIYNHPKLIDEPKGPGKIKINPRTGIPKDVLGSTSGKLTAKSLAQFDSINEKQRGPQSVAETMRSIVSELSIRPKDETPEERKERKRALKEYRKERRIERKANTEAFKEEKKRLEKVLMNNKKNIQGNRLV